MLASRERLAARQGQSGTPRHEYLQELVSEYARSHHWLRKEEIVANLANFAYDPINYAALRQLRVVELFVEVIAEHGEAGTSTDQEERTASTSRHGGASHESVSKSKRLLVEFAMGGICNCIPDPALQSGFIASDGVATVLKIVMQVPVDADPRALNTALSALTTVYFLLDSPAFVEIASDQVMAQMKALAQHPNVRLANIAKAYISRYDELLMRSRRWLIHLVSHTVWRRRDGSGALRLLASRHAYLLCVSYPDLESVTLKYTRILSLTPLQDHRDPYMCLLCELQLIPVKFSSRELVTFLTHGADPRTNAAALQIQLETRQERGGG